MKEDFWKIKDILIHYPISRSFLEKLMTINFPKPCFNHGKVKFWKKKEVVSYFETQIK